MSNSTDLQNSITNVVATTLPVPCFTIGVDLGDRTSHYCVLDHDGNAVDRGRLATTKRAFGKFFRSYARCRVIYEVGTHSKWVTLVLESIGCETVVANARRLKLISENDRKNDTNDSELLARLGRVDPKLLAPIKHRGMDNHAAQAVLRARDVLVATRTKLINCTRGLVKPLGARILSCGTTTFHKSARVQIPEELREATDPLIDTIEELTTRIHAYDKLVETMCSDRFPETKILRQVTGVGALTSLALVLVIEDPTRFTHSRSVGPFLGLVPRQKDSGKSEPELRISKVTLPRFGRHGVR